MAPSTPTTLPKGWPTTSPPIRYLPRPIASPKLPKSFPLPPAHPPSSNIRIRLITAASHPACGQHGLFTTRRIPAGEKVVPYHGVYHTAAESDPDSDYDLWVEKEWRAPGASPEEEPLAVGVDARFAGNEARFVNDYRGVAERPNARFDVDVEAGRVWVVALERGVGKGEELLVSYGKGFWQGRRQEEENGSENTVVGKVGEVGAGENKQKKNGKKNGEKQALDSKAKKNKTKGKSG